jgi:hypothetical protein
MNQSAPAPPSPRVERSPFREIPTPPEPNATLTNHEDDANVALRRRIPTLHHTLNPPSLDNAAIEEKRSRHFPSQASSSKTLVNNPSAPIAQARAFSPLRGRPSVIEIPSSPEDSNFASSSKLAEDAQPKAEPLSTEQLASSDYGGDDDLFGDPDFLAEIARVEAEALRGNKRGAATPAAPSTSTPTTSQSSNTTPDVIMIDDNDDKENMPVTTRRVRRRPAPSQADPGDIIDISD